MWEGSNMPQFNIAEAKAHLSELTRRAMDGEEVIIARDNKPLVKLVPLTAPQGIRAPGSGKGQLLWMAPDFDATPEGFEGNNFRPLGISLEHIARVQALPLHHRDPFDRLLLAQAEHEHLAVASADPVFSRYGAR
jgi:prevent-host-death family protein